MLKIRTVGPNIALIISKGRKRGVQVRIGGRVLYVPLLQRVDELSLELRTIEVSSTNATTRPGVPVTLTGVCQVKVSGYKELDSGVLATDENAIRLAAQHFIGRSRAQIEDSIAKTLEGHQRAIVGTLTVEELYRERETLSLRVRELAEGDMRAMGLAIVSYTISTITDEKGYIDALGVERTEQVKRDAMIGAAKFKEESRTRAYEEKVKADLHMNNQKVKKDRSDMETEKHAILMKQETVNAQVVQEKAKHIKEAEEEKKLAERENDTEESRLRGQVDIEKVRMAKKKVIMENELVVPAETKAMAQEREARGIKVIAAANAEEIRLKGKAEADAARAMANVETTKLMEEAKAYRNFEEGAISYFAIKALPSIARAIAEPLKQTEKMVFVGGANGGGPSRFTDDVMRIVAEVPETVKAITGIDLRDTFQHLTGAKKHIVPTVTNIGGGASA